VVEQLSEALAGLVERSCIGSAQQRQAVQPGL
jgi:hypothetical protein